MLAFKKNLPEILDLAPFSGGWQMDIGYLDDCYVFRIMDSPGSTTQKAKLRLNRNWCGKLTLFLPFFRCFTGGYAKIKKVPFFTLNTIVKILIS